MRALTELHPVRYDAPSPSSLYLPRPFQPRNHASKSRRLPGPGASTKNSCRQRLSAHRQRLSATTDTISEPHLAPTLAASIFHDRELPIPTRTYSRRPAPGSRDCGARQLRRVPSQVDVMAASTPDQRPFRRAAATASAAATAVVTAARTPSCTAVAVSAAATADCTACRTEACAAAIGQKLKRINTFMCFCRLLRKCK